MNADVWSRLFRAVLLTVKALFFEKIFLCTFEAPYFFPSLCLFVAYFGCGFTALCSGVSFS